MKSKANILLAKNIVRLALDAESYAVRSDWNELRMATRKVLSSVSEAKDAGREIARVLGWQIDLEVRHTDKKDGRALIVQGPGSRSVVILVATTNSRRTGIIFRN